MEDLGTEIDLVIARLSHMKTKVEELNFAAKRLQNNVTCLFGGRRSVS